jgi:hypothetical protein
MLRRRGLRLHPFRHGPAVFARYDPNAADVVFGYFGLRHSIILVGSTRVLAAFVTRNSRQWAGRAILFIALGKKRSSPFRS